MAVRELLAYRAYSAAHTKTYKVESPIEHAKKQCFVMDALACRLCVRTAHAAKYVQYASSSRTATVPMLHFTTNVVVKNFVSFYICLPSH